MSRTTTGASTTPRPTEPATASDWVRQGAVVVSAVACLAGGLLGSGALGGDAVAEAAGGALSADATFLAPAGPAFSVWSLIYLALGVFTVWHTLPRQAASQLARVVGWWASASMVLNALWLATVRAELLWLSVVVIVALALVIGQLLASAVAPGDGGGAGAWIVWGTFGLYLGWTSVATCANLAAVLVDAGVDPGRLLGETVAVVVLMVVCGLVWFLAEEVGPARWAVVATVVWGLSWIAYGRLQDQPDSSVVGIAAVVAALASLLLTAVVQRRRGWA